MSRFGTIITPREPSKTTWQVVGLVFAIGFPTLLTAVYFVGLAQAPAIWQQGVYATGKFLQFTFPILWLRWALCQPITGSWPTKYLLVPSLAFGALVMLGMLVLAHYWLAPHGYLDVAAEGVRRKIDDLGIHTPLRYAAVGFFYVAVHSLLEEYYWRWYVFAQLRERLPLLPAVTISSLAFMAHHVILLGIYFGWAAPATYLLSLSVAMGGIVWALLYERSGSLLGPWLSHALVDAGIFVLGFQLAAI